MKKFWLVLKPDTFLWIKNGEGIVYNSLNSKHFKFGCHENIKKLCDTLLDLDSLYSVEITQSLLSNRQVKKWIDDIISTEAGMLIEQNGKNKKLVSYYPYLKIQDNKEHLLWEHELNIGGKIIENLDELIFYINGSPFGSDQLYKQTNYPLASNRSFEFEKVESFVRKCRNGSISKIVFVGDVLNYKDLEKLQKWVSSNEYPVHVILLADDINADIIKAEWFSCERVSISIVVNDYATFPEQFEFLNDISNKVSWKFPVSSIAQFELANSIMQEKNLTDCELIPLYDGKNKAFFEENIYMTKEEFEEINLSRRQVFINMALNIHYFGKLTIMPNGEVYADVNQEPLGDIDTPIYNMVFKEMTDGHSWLRVRDAEPCSNCIYQWLCPSPGNYEHVMGKPNLCHVFGQEEKVDAAIITESYE